MRPSTKRFLSLLLCLVMLGTYIPASASQREAELLPDGSAAVAADAASLSTPENTAAVTAAVVNAKPTITAQPKNVTMSVNCPAKFTVKATGATTYQWYWRKSSSGSWAKSTMTGNATATLTVTAATVRNGYQYRCKVSNSSGYVYTSAATLTVTPKPVVTTQPAGTSVKEGATAKFTVKAAGAKTYQWYWRKDSSGTWAKSTMTGNKTATLSVPAAKTRNGYQYRCKVSNSNGYVYTKPATLTVLLKPVITAQPKSITKNAGETAKFTVKATGATGYQWYWREDSSGTWQKSTRTGNKTATLSIPATMARNGYQYRCKVSNDNGYVYSKVATLTVNGLPVIVDPPKSVSITEGGTATFTVTGKNVDSYQWYWWKESESRWSPCSGHGATTNTLQYDDVLYSWNNYIFSCKLTNSEGVQWTLGVSLTITARHVPVIKTQPKSVTVGEGEKAYFFVQTRYEDGYQWYWRKNSSSEWNELSATTQGFTVNSAKYSQNGYQYRCRVYNSEYSVYSNTVTLTVNPVMYRALLVAEVNFYSMEAAPRFQGSADLVANMLQSAKGPMGRAYTVTSMTDLGKAGLEDAIRDAYAGADDNDVSLFYIATHGATDYASGKYAGELLLAGPYGDVYFRLEMLAECLLAVPGKVIVFLDSCGSGAALWDGNGSGAASDEGQAVFNEAAIAAFAEAEKSLASPNTGELIDPKFYVITSAAHQEMSWGTSALNYTYFGWYLALGPLGRKPADEEGDGNGTVTLNELYNYVYTHALGPYTSDGVDYYQHAQVYPENSSYELFK